MPIDLWMLGLLWSISFIYPDLISRIFEPLLVAIVVSAGVCSGLVRYIKHSEWYKQSNASENQQDRYINSWLLSSLQTFSAYFLPLLLLLLVRTCLFDVSRVVSGSLKPTVLVGDTILIKKYRYGIRLPLTGYVIIPINEPKRGDIIAFRFPQDPSKIFIKRVVGLPNDEIQYTQKQLMINGKLIEQSVLGIEQTQENGKFWTAIKSEEDLLGKKHMIYSGLYNPAEIRPATFTINQADKKLSLKVPTKQYFVMGDNRDNSLDSRHWGFVSNAHLLGEVRHVVFSLNTTGKWYNPLTWIRWGRLSMPIV